MNSKRKDVLLTFLAVGLAACGGPDAEQSSTADERAQGLEAVEDFSRVPFESDRMLDNSLIDTSAVATRPEDPAAAIRGSNDSLLRAAEPAKLLTMERAIEGRYIVVLRNEYGNRVDEIVQEVVDSFQVNVLFVYRAAIQGFAVSMDEAVMEELRYHPAVHFIEEDAVVEKGAVQQGATWGIDRIDSRTGTDGNYEFNFDGTGVSAYIIDTGIRQAHSEFTGRIGNGYDSVDNDTNPEDCDGHGTHVAGTVGGTTYGVAKNVTLHGVRVLNCSGSGSTAGVIAGVDWVAINASGPSVGNMSLGGGASSALDGAVNGAVSSGVVMVVSAGNSNTNACSQSPARAASALTIGSTDSSDTRSSFSNFGTCVDLFAPGSAITSAWSTGNNATRTISGTSMAAPHVAGIAALFLDETPQANTSEVSSSIINNATAGVISSAGSGSPNLLAYSLFGQTPPPPPPPPPPSSPCTFGAACEAYSGSLTGTGDWDAQPNGTYFQVGRGVHYGWLEGPSNADFDLELRRWNGWSWSRVARSISPTSSESIVYTGSSGFYYWRIVSYSGSGAYDFWMVRP